MISILVATMVLYDALNLYKGPVDFTGHPDADFITTIGAQGLERTEAPLIWY
jgi:hypothetical protein